MKAAVLREGRIQVKETPDPTPGPGEILVKTRACGICASDLHFMDHPHTDDTGMSHYDPHADIVMGHEYCAEIVDYGPETERKWAKGTRVTSQPVLLRKTGPKIIGYNADVPGGFGEYFVMTEAITKVIEAAIPDELVALVDPISVGWYYARRAEIGPKDIPLVIGCGAIGLSVIASLKLWGIGPIIAADFVASRRETALAMGADVAIDPAEISPYAAWRELAYGSATAVRGFMDAADPGKKAVIFECVGVPGVLDSIIKGCERETRILSAGGPPAGDHLSTYMAKRKGLNIQFGGGPQMFDFNDAFEAISSGRMDISSMVGRLVSLDEMPKAIDDSRNASSPARIVLML